MKVYNHTDFDDSQIEQGRSAKKRKESEDAIVLLGCITLAAVLLYIAIKSI